MQPSDLADRIEALDWSRTSLQHQLVMSAAILALRGGDVPELENPVGEMQNLLRDLILAVDKLLSCSKVATSNDGAATRNEANDQHLRNDPRPSR